MKLGLQKEGKGVSKQEKPRKGLFLFFAVFLGRFWKLMGLNLLYLLVCLPVVTIGPATAAMVYILKKYVQEDAALIWRDFWANFKSNFRQALPLGLISTLFIAGLIFASFFYFAQGAEAEISFLLAMLSLIGLAIVIPALYYAYLIMVSVVLPLNKIVKNALIMTVMRFGRSAAVFALTGGLTLLMIELFPLSLILIVLFAAVLQALIACFLLYPVVHELMIAPKRKENERPKEKAIFADTTDDDR